MNFVDTSNVVTTMPRRHRSGTWTLYVPPHTWSKMSKHLWSTKITIDLFTYFLLIIGSHCRFNDTVLHHAKTFEFKFSNRETFCFGRLVLIHHQHWQQNSSAAAADIKYHAVAQKHLSQIMQLNITKHLDCVYRKTSDRSQVLVTSGVLHTNQGRLQVW